jgi:regulator of sirC expression with transglutaminase-like and TPR domain
VDPLAHWRELVQRPDRELPLDEAALAIAAHANPSLDMAAQLSRLDDMAAQVGKASTEGVCAVLFGDLGLRGDQRTYDDPRNSYLDQVLDRRLGIPISLSVLLIEVGRRCGLTLEGVGMPGHFLVRDVGSPELLIDAFAGGRRLDHQGCQQLLRSVAQAPVDLDAGMLAPVGSRAIVIRMLANLHNSFVRRADRSGLAWVTRLQAGIPGLPMGNQMELATQLAGFGLYDEAADLLEALASDPTVDAEVAGKLRTQATGVRANLN